MATCTLKVATASTSNATSYQSGSFTPDANGLMVVAAVASGRTDASPTCTDSLGAVTFQLITTCAKNSSADKMYLFVANQLAAASARTITVGGFSGNATGCVVSVYSVTGIARLGSSAVRQFKTQPNGAAASTPNPAFTSAALTANPCIGFVGNSTSPATMTPPSGWTESTTPAGDVGYSTPTSGSEVCHINSGFTGTTVTWGSTSASAFGAIVVELDSSSPIASNISGHGTEAGTISGSGAMVGHVTGVATVAAGVKGSGNIAVSAAGHATFSGNGKLLALVASSMAGHAAVSDTLRGSGAVSIAVSSLAVFTGTAKGAGFISDSIAAHATVVPGLKGSAPLSSTIHGQASSSNTLRGKSSLASLAAGHSTVTAMVSGNTVLSLAVHGQSSLSGVLRGLFDLQSVIFAHADATAAIIGKTYLSSSFDGTSGFSIVPGGISPIQAAIQASSGMVAGLSGAGQITAALVGESFIIFTPIVPSQSVSFTGKALLSALIGGSFSMPQCCLSPDASLISASLLLARAQVSTSLMLVSGSSDAELVMVSGKISAGSGGN